MLRMSLTLFPSPYTKGNFKSSSVIVFSVLKEKFYSINGLILNAWGHKGDMSSHWYSQRALKWDFNLVLLWAPAKPPGPSKWSVHYVLYNWAMGPSPANCWHTIYWTTGPWWQPKQTIGTQCAGPLGHGASPSKLLADTVLDHWSMGPSPANCWHTLCWTTGRWWQPQQTVGTQCGGPLGHGASPSKLLAHNVLDHWAMEPAPANCWHTMCWTTGPWGQPQQTVGTQCAGPQGHGAIPSKLLAPTVLDHWSMVAAPANCWHTMCWTTGPWWQPQQTVGTQCAGPLGQPQQTVGTQCAGPLGQPQQTVGTQCAGPLGQPQQTVRTQCAGPLGHGASPSKLLAHNVLDHWAMGPAPANCWHTMCWTTGG